MPLKGYSICPPPCLTPLMFRTTYQGSSKLRATLIYNLTWLDESPDILKYLDPGNKSGNILRVGPHFLLHPSYVVWKALWEVISDL